MLLADYIGRYSLERGISTGREQQIRYAVRSLENYCGGPIRLEELDEELVSGWLKERQATLAPDTVAGNRRIILALWRGAAENGLARAPQKVRQIRLGDHAIRAFTHQDLTRLLVAADSLKGTFRNRNIFRRIYWRSYILASYDTALRRCDMLSLSVRDIFRRPDGVGFISLVQLKTKRRHAVCFTRVTMRAIDECMGDDDRYLIWPEWAGRRQWFRAFRHLCEVAGVSGTSKFIRRSAASYAESQRHGAGPALLGHASPVMFARSYDDRSISQPEPVMPPPFAE